MSKDDFLILGAGWGGLAAASLLAREGLGVTVLEAQDRAGGAGQSFALGDFHFCAEMQYLMGCGPGGVVHGWLDRLGLLDEIEFNSLDPDGYDRIEFPGRSFRIPHDAHRYQTELTDAFPEEKEGIEKLFEVLFDIEKELDGQVFEVGHMLRDPFRFKNTLLYGPWPAKRVFEHFDLSPELQAVLAGQCGDIGLSPKDEPFLCLQAVMFGYCESAHFPARGMGYFVQRIERFITEHGGSIHYSTPVTSIESDRDRVRRVQTPRGAFSADTVISNIDPATTMRMIDGASVPDYELTTSCFTIFLGLDIDLASRGFGRWNTWHYPDVDIDESIRRTLEDHDYSDPFFFLSTPSLVADPGVLAPEGCTTVQINVGSDYDYFAAALERGDHDKVKERVTRAILDAVCRRLLPDLDSHCVVQEAWTPVDLARRTGLARGGMYGARLDFTNRVIRRVSQRTDFENLFRTGATAGGPGLQGVVAASTRLVDRILALRGESRRAS